MGVYEQVTLSRSRPAKEEVLYRLFARMPAFHSLSISFVHACIRGDDAQGSSLEERSTGYSFGG